MKQVFRAHRLCKQDGPLGPYIDSYAAEMRGGGYARQTREVQTRLVADFGRWLAKRGILAQKITPELFPPYLRARARRRRPTRNDLSALQRLWDLLVRQGVVTDSASHPDPVVALIVCLLAPLAMADDGIVTAQRTPPREQLQGEGGQRIGLVLRLWQCDK